MRRMLMVAAAGLSLAGCGTMSGFDAFKPAAPEGVLRLDSKPAGAEARTSTGQACRTPCNLKLPIGEGFSVTFSLDKHLPQTVAVQVLQVNSDAPVEEGAPSPAFDPNPIYVELQTAKGAKKKPVKRAPASAKPRPAGTQGADPAASPFPPPQQQPSAFPPPTR